MSENTPIPPPEKLVGGWVAGNLTEAERKALLDAALGDQALFNALADEEGLREVLAEPGARAELAALVAPSRESWWRWLFRPAPMAAFSAGALAVLAFVTLRPALEVTKAPMKEAPAVVIESTTAAPVLVPAPEPVLRAARPAPGSPAPSPAKSLRRDAPLADSVSVAIAVAGNKEDKRVARPADAVALPPLPPALAPEPAAGPPAVRAEAEKIVARAPVRAEARAEAGKVAAQAPATAASSSAAANEARELAKDEKAKKSGVAGASAPPPLRYRVERRQAGGEWVEVGGELTPGAEARLAVTASEAGQLTLRGGRTPMVVPVAAGETVYYPATGGLPAEAGEREVAMLFRAGVEGGLAQPRPFGALSGALGGRQREAAAATAAPLGYSVTVKLRYR